jgi:hypothetical protein
MKPRTPFSILGIDPTLDAATVKRAYFQQLTLHPPHKDPEGFRCLRAAYEVLRQPSGLAAAYLEAGVDLEAAMVPYRQRFDAALLAAQDQARSPELPAQRFFNLVSRLSYQEAARRFA